MRLTLLAMLLAPLLSGAESAGPPASIVRLPMPAEDGGQRPLAVPTEPENTVELDFPWPVDDWAGRGFTPDPEKFAGDFVIEATRGQSRIFVTPVASGAHRILDVVLAPPGLPARSEPIEFLPAPEGLAWRKVVLTDGDPPRKPRPFLLSPRPPASAWREASPESELGLIRTMRLMAGMNAEDAQSLASSNPALEFAVLGGAPRSFGDFTVEARFALRDASTGALGICAGVSNPTRRRLIFDPETWVIRAGERAYPVRTVDFPNEVEPGSSCAAFLVLARAQDGAPMRLLPDNAFELSVALKGSVSTRPVVRMPLEGYDE